MPTFSLKDTLLYQSPPETASVAKIASLCNDDFSSASGDPSAVVLASVWISSSSSGIVRVVSSTIRLEQDEFLLLCDCVSCCLRSCKHKHLGVIPDAYCGEEKGRESIPGHEPTPNRQVTPRRTALEQGKEEDPIRISCRWPFHFHLPPPIYVPATTWQ